MNILILTITFLLLWYPRLVTAEAFMISDFKNTNQLIWDQKFRDHITHFFGEKQGYYFWNGLLSEQIIAGLGGPPENIVEIDNNTYLATACRAHSCPEKVAYLVRGDLALFGTIGFMCPTQSGTVEYNENGCLNIFYHDLIAKKELEQFLTDWTMQYVPQASTYYVNIKTSHQ